MKKFFTCLFIAMIATISASALAAEEEATHYTSQEGYTLTLNPTPGKAVFCDNVGTCVDFFYSHTVDPIAIYHDERQVLALATIEDLDDDDVIYVFFATSNGLASDTFEFTKNKE